MVSKLERENEYRDFGGKPYKFHEAYSTMSLAKKAVKHLRCFGDLARVVCIENKYVVYWREK